MIDLYDYVFNSEEDIPEKVVDETGAVLTPCRPETCEGNGMHSDLKFAVMNVIGFSTVFLNSAIRIIARQKNKIKHKSYNSHSAC